VFESYGFVGEEPALYHGSKSVLDIPRPLNPVVPQMIDESRVGCEAREREYIRNCPQPMSPGTSFLVLGVPPCQRLLIEQGKEPVHPECGEQQVVVERLSVQYLEAEGFAGKERILGGSESVLASRFVKHPIEAVDGSSRTPQPVDLRKDHREQKRDPNTVRAGHYEEIDIVLFPGATESHRPGNTNQADPRAEYLELAGERTSRLDAAVRQAVLFLPLTGQILRALEDDFTSRNDQVLLERWVAGQEFFEGSRRIKRVSRKKYEQFREGD